MTNKLRFPAVGVCGAIDSTGKLQVKLIKKGGIKTEDFVEFLRRVKRKYPKGPVYILLDNLHAHHADLTTNYAERVGIKLVFNASYNSEINPIERLWNYAKRAFQKEAVKIEDWGDHKRIHDLVKKCLKGVNPESLRMRVKTCLKLMKDDLERLN